MGDENLTSDQNHEIAPQRVKIYQLNTESSWEDIGTGFCFYQIGEDERPDRITVRSEEDDSILLTSDVLKRRLYQKQQDTLIVWTEDDNRDLALSFQDSLSCDLIWNLINKQQQEDNHGGDHSSPTEAFSESITLPDVTLANLNEILSIISSAQSTFEKDAIAAKLTDYLEKFSSLFNDCERLGKITDIHLLYSTLVSMFMLNNHALTEQLTNDENIMNVLGILEYNPNTPKMKSKYRKYVRQKCDAREALKVLHTRLKSWVNQIYRMDFLLYVISKDLRQITASVINTLNNIILQHRVAIAAHFPYEDTMLKELFNCEEDNKDDAILFIHELCELTKDLDSSVRLKFYESFLSHGLLDYMCRSLAHSSSYVRSMAIRQLQSFIEINVDGIRQNLYTQALDPDRPSLIQVIVERSIADSDHDLKIHYFEILRLLLEPYSSISNNKTQPISISNRTLPNVREFIRLFHERYMDVLLRPIDEIDIKSQELKGPIETLYLSSNQAQICQYVCDFLNFSVKSHGRHIKDNILQSDIIKKVNQLYRSSHTYIKLCALRFIRACVSTLDEKYIEALVNENAFEPTIRVLLDTNGRDCLLNSALLELFEYVRKENIKALIDYLIIKFGTILNTITYISTFKDLRLRYDQNVEIQETSSSDLLESNLDRNTNHDGWYSSTVDDGEEDYFNTSDEEQETLDNTQERDPQDTKMSTLEAEYDTNSDGALDTIMESEKNFLMKERETSVNTREESTIGVQKEFKAQKRKLSSTEDDEDAETNIISKTRKKSC